MAVNVMKKVKKPRVQKPRALPITKKAAAASKKHPTFVFSKKNPYSAFYDIDIDDVGIAIEQYISTLDIDKDIDEISSMKKVRNSLPIFLIPDFLKSLNPDNVTPIALRRFKELPRVKEALNEMNKILDIRSLRGINVPIISKDTEEKDLESVINELKSRPVEIPRATKYLKKQSLKSMSKEYLLRLAERENIPNYAILSKKNLVSELMKVDFAKRKERFYDAEISICESTYKRAPWIRSENPVAGIAVKRDSKYATDFKVKDDWFRANKSFYKDVCKFGRIFEQDSIAYFFRDGSLKIETKEMYDASVDYKDTSSFKHDPVFRRKYTKTVVKAPLTVNQRKISELAPGLFSHLRTIFSDQVFYCDTCNTYISDPVYKSVDDGKRILFCSEACFQSYLFGSTSSISSSE